MAAMPTRSRKRPLSRPATPPTVPAAAALRNELAKRGADGWFNADEAAVYLDLARRTVRNLISRRELVADGRARGPLFRRQTLDAFLEARARG